MKETKLQQLWAAARKEPAPEVPFTFSQSVLGALRREQNQPPAVSLLDQLGGLFPRLAWAAALIIGLCVAGEVYFAGAGENTAAEVTQAAEEWLYAAN